MDYICRLLAQAILSQSLPSQPSASGHHGLMEDSGAAAAAAEALAASPKSVAPAPRWVAPVFCALAAILLPWTVLLAETLPRRNLSRHWDVAWVGFDVGLLVTLALTAWCAYRRSLWVGSAATAAATLLICDAWFDVVTARRGRELATAVTEAVFVELPLAAISLWIAGHAEQVTERAKIFLERRAARTPQHDATPP
jgi:hypothetical protein